MEDFDTVAERRQYKYILGISKTLEPTMRAFCCVSTPDVIAGTKSLGGIRCNADSILLRKADTRTGTKAKAAREEQKKRGSMDLKVLAKLYSRGQSIHSIAQTMGYKPASIRMQLGNLAMDGLVTMREADVSLLWSRCAVDPEDETLRERIVSMYSVGVADKVIAETCELTIYAMRIVLAALVGEGAISSEPLFVRRYLHGDKRKVFITLYKKGATWTVINEHIGSSQLMVRKLESYLIGTGEIKRRQ